MPDTQSWKRGLGQGDSLQARSGENDEGKFLISSKTTQFGNHLLPIAIQDLLDQEQIKRHMLTQRCTGKTRKEEALSRRIQRDRVADEPEGGDKEEKSLPFVEREGHRLGLPVDQGQLWVLAWSTGTMQATTSVRKRMIAENVVLDHLKSPLIFFDDDMAVILLEGQVPQNPSKVRDALLSHCGAHLLWIIQGGHYHSLHDLKTTLTHTLSLARKARRDNYVEYLLDNSTFGLDSFLENPRLAGDLDAFARRLLTPLLEYDAANSSHLTDTFVLAKTLGSAQAVAEQLGVHVNTIRYRLRRAEDLLGTDQTSPKEHAALVLAAFTWQRFHTTEQAPS